MNQEQVPTKKLADKRTANLKQTGKPNPKPEDLTRWESEGGAVIPTGALPKDQVPQPALHPTAQTIAQSPRKS